MAEGSSLSFETVRGFGLRELVGAMVSGKLNPTIVFKDIPRNLEIAFGVGWTLLHLAAHEGDFSKVQFIVESFISKGAKDIIDAQTTTGKTALHLIGPDKPCDPVFFLVASGAQIKPDNAGKTAIEYARLQHPGKPKGCPTTALHAFLRLERYLLHNPPPPINHTDRFSLANAYIMGLFSKLIYENFHISTRTSTALAPSIGGQTKGFEGAHGKALIERWGYRLLFMKERFRIRCFIIEDAKSTIIIFRGTKKKTNWIVNLNAVSKSQCHLGFSEALKTVWSDIVRFVDPNSTKSIYITGHSLGGALATLCTFRLNRHLKICPSRLFLYTFGQPRVALQQLQIQFDNDFPFAYIVTRDGDAIPSVPPSPPYHHVGSYRHIDHNGLLVNDPYYKCSDLSESFLKAFKLKASPPSVDPDPANSSINKIVQQMQQLNLFAGLWGEAKQAYEEQVLITDTRLVSRSRASSSVGFSPQSLKKHSMNGYLKDLHNLYLFTHPDSPDKEKQPVSSKASTVIRVMKDCWDSESKMRRNRHELQLAQLDLIRYFTLRIPPMYRYQLDLASPDFDHDLHVSWLEQEMQSLSLIKDFQSTISTQLSLVSSISGLNQSQRGSIPSFDFNATFRRTPSARGSPSTSTSFPVLSSSPPTSSPQGSPIIGRRGMDKIYPSEYYKVPVDKVSPLSRVAMRSVIKEIGTWPEVSPLLIDMTIEFFQSLYGHDIILLPASEAQDLPSSSQKTGTMKLSSTTNLSQALGASSSSNSSSSSIPVLTLSSSSTLIASSSSAPSGPPPKMVLAKREHYSPYQRVFVEELKNMVVFEPQKKEMFLQILEKINVTPNRSGTRYNIEHEFENWAATLSSLFLVKVVGRHRMTSTVSIDSGDPKVQSLLVVTKNRGLIGGALQAEYTLKCTQAMKSNTEKFGRRNVWWIQVGDSKIHIKESPEMPGLERASYLFGSKVIGEGVVSSSVGRMEIVTPSSSSFQTSTIPVLISRTVEGKNFQSIIDNPSELKRLNLKRFSKLFLLHLLMLVEDGKADNFMYTEDPTDNTIVLHSIDNDHVFVPPFLKGKFGHKKLNMKSVLFCLDQMNERVDPSVIREFLALNIEETLESWLHELEEESLSYVSESGSREGFLFSLSEFQQLLETGKISSETPSLLQSILTSSPSGNPFFRNPSTSSSSSSSSSSAPSWSTASPSASSPSPVQKRVRKRDMLRNMVKRVADSVSKTEERGCIILKPLFQKGMIFEMFTRMKEVQKLWRNNENISHFDTLQAVLPDVAYIYSQVLFDHSITPWARFNKICGDSYEKMTLDSSETRAGSVDILQSTNVPLEEVFRNPLSHQYGPKQQLADLKSWMMRDNSAELQHLLSLLMRQEDAPQFLKKFGDKNLSNLLREFFVNRTFKRHIEALNAAEEEAAIAAAEKKADACPEAEQNDPGDGYSTDSGSASPAQLRKKSQVILSRTISNKMGKQLSGVMVVEEEDDDDDHLAKRRRKRQQTKSKSKSSQTSSSSTSSSSSSSSSSGVSIGTPNPKRRSSLGGISEGVVMDQVAMLEQDFDGPLDSSLASSFGASSEDDDEEEEEEDDDADQQYDGEEDDYEEEETPVKNENKFNMESLLIRGLLQQDSFRFLDFSGFEALTNDSLDRIVRNNAATLEKIYLKDVTTITRIGSKSALGLIKLRVDLPRLRVLDIRGCENLVVCEINIPSTTVIHGASELVQRSERYVPLLYSETSITKLELYEVPIRTLSSSQFGRLSLLRSIYLEGCKLKSLPDSIGNMIHLNKLSIYENRISSLPETMTKLTNLFTLNIGYNRFSEVPKIVYEIQSLKALYNEGNSCTKLSTKITTLPHLRKIDFSSNPFGRFDKTIFTLTKITSLSLAGINITHLTSSIKALGPCLTRLDLSENQFGEFPEALTSLPNLSTLTLSSVGMVCVPDQISKLSNLHHLYLDYNEIASIADGISQLSKLTLLQLDCNALVSIPECIYRLSSLKYLHLCSNDITRLPSKIKKLKKLREFYISDNNLSSLPSALQSLEKLRYFSVYDNSLTGEAEQLMHFDDDEVEECATLLSELTLS